MTRKKKAAKPAPKKPAEKRPETLTTDEAITRLFPKPVIDTLRHDFDLSRDPKRRSTQEE